MRAKYFILINLLFFSTNCLAQVRFQKTYQDSPQQQIITTYDGNYIMVAEIPHGSFWAAFLMKIDVFGDTLWTKSLKDTTLTYNVEQCKDSGFIISGSRVHFGQTTTRNIVIIKTDKNGDVQWIKSYYNQANDRIYYIRQTHDNNFIAVGFSDQRVGAGGYVKSLLMKLNSEGDTIWTRTFVSSTQDFFYNVVETSDSSYLITGIVYDSLYNTDLTFGNLLSLMKISNDGNVIWSRTYVLLTSTAISNVKETNNGYVLCGSSQDVSTSGKHFIFLFKIDFSGNPIWCKTYCSPLYEEVGNFTGTKDGGFIITGGFITSEDNLFKVLLINVNSEGDIVFTNGYYAKIFSNGTSVIATSDSGFIIAGFTADTMYSGNPAPYLVNGVAYLIKTDAEGNSGCNELQPVIVADTFHVQSVNVPLNITSSMYSLPISANISSGGIINTICFDSGITENVLSFQIKIYPNPTNGIINIATDKVFLNGIVIIYNSIGQQVYIDNIKGTCKTININLSSGIYFITILAKEKFWTDKIIIE